jgi:hypothetical protein
MINRSARKTPLSNHESQVNQGNKHINELLSGKKNTYTTTTCKKGGVKIRDTRGDSPVENPLANINPFAEESKVQIQCVYDNLSYESLDLNIENYSRPDLFRLFGLDSMNLSENTMRDCKKIVLKTHPDKSRMEPKYFLFFSAAYKKLYSIYEFQNKTKKVVEKVTEDEKQDTITIKKPIEQQTQSPKKGEYYDESEAAILERVFETKKDLKDPKNFNQWFNSQFEKHKLEEPAADSGYGSWLKSDEDIVYMQNVSRTNMNSEIEKHKKQVQTLTEYKGVNEPVAALFSGSSLMEYNSNFTSNSLFSNDGMNYTDLRQAYAESVIPVTEDDYKKAPKYNSVDEYRRHRESANMEPLSKEEATRQLFHKNQSSDEESAALAFYYAEQAEKSRKNQEMFWSGLKQLTN